MTYDDDLFEIRRLIIEHASSPSLRHIRDHNAIQLLSRRITPRHPHPVTLTLTPVTPTPVTLAPRRQPSSPPNSQPSPILPQPPHRTTIPSTH